MALEPTVPSTPRNGQYLAVFGFTDTEGGGDIRIEVDECKTCYAVVEKSRMDSHVATHEAQSGATPKGAPAF
jgi:hypothetical protein